MEILVIDRDSLNSQLIASKLLAEGHIVVMEPNKNEAIDKIAKNNFACIMLDPAPLSEAQPIINGIYKNINSAAVKPYIMLLSKNATTEAAVISGCNDVLLKPLDASDLYTKIENAERFMEICHYLGQEDKEISALRMINKSAFNQLFLSAVDRSFRYGERCLIVFINIGNFESIKETHGEDGAEKVLAKVAEKMNFMRRQSDIIGHIGNGDFAILLQRPQYETEPLDAINRFTETLDSFRREFDLAGVPAPEFELDLVEIPQGVLHDNRAVPSETANEAAAPAMQEEPAAG